MVGEKDIRSASSKREGDVWKGIVWVVNDLGWVWNNLRKTEREIAIFTDILISEKAVVETAKEKMNQLYEKKLK